MTLLNVNGFAKETLNDTNRDVIKDKINNNNKKAEDEFVEVVSISNGKVKKMRFSMNFGNIDKKGE